MSKMSCERAEVSAMLAHLSANVTNPEYSYDAVREKLDAKGVPYMADDGVYHQIRLQFWVDHMVPNVVSHMPRAIKHMKAAIEGSQGVNSGFLVSLRKYDMDKKKQIDEKVVHLKLHQNWAVRCDNLAAIMAALMSDPWQLVVVSPDLPSQFAPSDYYSLSSSVIYLGGWEPEGRLEKVEQLLAEMKKNKGLIHKHIEQGDAYCERCNGKIAYFACKVRNSSPTNRV